MGKYIGPKEKISRRVGENLYLKGSRSASPKAAIVRRNYPPGVHGPKGRQRLSEYGVQLQEKQKARFMYGLRERQMANYYKKAIASTTNTGEEILRLLERRLDNVIFKLGWAQSRAQARQLVSHGHILLNDRPHNIPSYQMIVGDRICLKEKVRNFQLIKDNLGSQAKQLADWLDFNSQDVSATVLRLPKVDDLNLGIDSKLIVEYYSR
jgi:small subunit ribosomal protein S4